MSWKAQGCVWGALAAEAEKPGVPGLSEPFGIEDFIGKGRSGQGACRGDHGPRVAGSKAEGSSRWDHSGHQQLPPGNASPVSSTFQSIVNQKL